MESGPAEAWVGVVEEIPLCQQSLSVVARVDALSESRPQVWPSDSPERSPLGSPQAGAAAVRQSSRARPRADHLAVTQAAQGKTYADAGRYVRRCSRPLLPPDSPEGKGYAATKASSSTPFKADSQGREGLQRPPEDLAGLARRAPSARTASRHYTLALNGFVADLSSAQAGKLAAEQERLLPAADSRRQPDTWHTPDFLGLTRPGRGLDHPRRLGQGRRRHRRRYHRLRHLALHRRPSRARADDRPLGRVGPYDGRRRQHPHGEGRRHRLPRQVPGRRAVRRLALQLQAHRRALLPRHLPANVDLADPDRSSSPPRDGTGHGSHTASTAAGNPGSPA